MNKHKPTWERMKIKKKPGECFVSRQPHKHLVFTEVISKRTEIIVVLE